MDLYYDSRLYVLVGAVLVAAFVIGVRFIWEIHVWRTPLGLILVATSGFAVYAFFHWIEKPIDPELLLEQRRERDKMRLFRPHEFDHEYGWCPRCRTTVSWDWRTCPDCRSKLVDQPGTKGTS